MDDIQKIDRMHREGKISDQQARLLKEAFQHSSVSRETMNEDVASGGSERC